jgi:hypothetical protein
MHIATTSFSFHIWHHKFEFDIEHNVHDKEHKPDSSNSVTLRGTFHDIVSFHDKKISS